MLHFGSVRNNAHLSVEKSGSLLYFSFFILSAIDEGVLPPPLFDVVEISRTSSAGKTAFESAEYPSDGIPRGRATSALAMAATSLFLPLFGHTERACIYIYLRLKVIYII